MQFLHELGVEVEGVDYAEASRTLAPPDVRDLIHIGSVTYDSKAVSEELLGGGGHGASGGRFCLRTAT